MSGETSAAAVAGRQEFRGLQALRAVAALTVVAGHSTDFLLRANGTLPAMFRYMHGPAGVDIFFVISGFVMAVSARRLRTRPHPARLFLLRRIIRIVPLYWLLTIAKYLTTTLDPRLSVAGKPRLAELLFSLLFLPFRSGDGSVHPLIPVGWTLSFEMLFYLIFAAALTIRGGYKWVLAPTILLLAVLSLYRGQGWPLWTALVDPIVLEFLAGFGIGMLTLERTLPSRMLGGMFVLLGVAILVTILPVGPPLLRVATWGVGASALVLGVVTLEGVFGPLLPASVLLLGDASYSIYLVQSFVFPVLHGVLDRMAPGLVHVRPALAGAAMLLAGVISTAVVGVLTYRLVESPVTGALRRWADAQRPVPVAP